MDQWVMSFPGLAPCQCRVFLGIRTITPGVRSCCSASVAMMPVPSGAHQDLIRRVRVPAVARARLEMDLGESEISAVLASDGRERVDLAGEDVGDAPRGPSHLGLDDPHAGMVARIGQT